MRRRDYEFVLVIDEHETTVGGLALENILDVITGDLEHEFDPAVLAAIRRDADGLVAPGPASLYAVARALGVNLDDVHEATVGGAVMELLGRVPEPGEVVELDDLRLEVLDVQDGRIKEVRILPMTTDRAPTRH
jgi:CBS domain containing-hemolysin-like protein